MSQKKFVKEHIKGEAPKNKPINTQGNFDEDDKRYLSIRPSGDPKGTRIPGTKPGQKKTVVNDISYSDTRYGKPAGDGVGPFMVTGKKKDKSMKPEHLDGHVEKQKTGEAGKGKYKDRHGNEYSECSSSSSAYYSP